MKYLFYIVLFLYAGISFVGCVKEDTSNCPPAGITVEPEDRVLHFKAIPGKYRFENIAETLQLYAYNDEVSPQVAFELDMNARLLADYKYVLPWSKWVDTEHYDYHVMGILNLNDHYEFVNTNNLRTFQTHIQPAFESTVNHDIQDVFVGYFDFNSRTRTVKGDTLYLEKLTNLIHVTVELRGFELSEGSELMAKISGNNSSYDYRNNPLTDCFMNYYPYNEVYKITPSHFKFDIVTGKLYIGDDLELEVQLYDEEGNLENKTSEFMLVDYIARIQDVQGNYLYNTNQKLREEDEFFIHIIIDEGFTILEVVINNWYWVNPGIDL